MRGFVPSKTPLARACEQVHREGGVCIVNHPGPGPMMWEAGLWEAQGARVGALEVYNGQALAAAGLHFEALYLQATVYSGLGLRLAAVTGADTHGPQAVAVARAAAPLRDGAGAAGAFGAGHGRRAARAASAG